MANEITWRPIIGIMKSNTSSQPADEADKVKEEQKHTDVKLENCTFHIGDTVRVHYTLIEKEKEAGKAKKQMIEKIRERIQVFEGIVIAIRGSQENTMFTVRKIGSAAIGIERIFPLNSPWIKKIDVKKYGDVRRAKLYYLRDRTGKSASYVKEKSSFKHKTGKSKTKKSTK